MVLRLRLDVADGLRVVGNIYLQIVEQLSQLLKNNWDNCSTLTSSQRLRGLGGRMMSDEPQGVLAIDAQADARLGGRVVGET